MHRLTLTGAYCLSLQIVLFVSSRETRLCTTFFIPSTTFFIYFASRFALFCIPFLLTDFFYRYFRFTTYCKLLNTTNPIKTNSKPAYTTQNKSKKQFTFTSSHQPQHLRSLAAFAVSFNGSRTIANSFPFTQALSVFIFYII